MLDAVARLSAIEEIRQLKARYCRFADSGDLSSYRALFTIDATIDVRGSTGSSMKEQGDKEPIPSFDEAGIFNGRDAFVDYIERVQVPGTFSAHHCHNDEIDIISDSRASAIFAMEDNVWFPTDQGVQHMHGFGYYHDTFEKHDGNWLIASLRLQRIHVQIR